MSHPHAALYQAFGNGLLSFPVTDMDQQGNFAPASYIQRLQWFISHPVSAVFVAGGTGEFFSLSPEEYHQVVHLATKTIQGKVPVVSSLGRSIPEAIAFASLAEAAGIDALLLMPPYLADGPEQGRYAYAKTILDNTSLPVIYYNRSTGILSPTSLHQLAEECPNLIGVKDGTGNMQELNDLIRTVGDRLVYIGGVRTAEIIAEAYLAMGVNTYSSAVFNFVPDFALHFYRCLREGDKAAVQRMLRTFYIPFVRLRKHQKGYAVSLIKAGAQLIGKDAGPVRPPLVMPSSEEREWLQALIDTANDCYSP